MITCNLNEIDTEPRHVIARLKSIVTAESSKAAMAAVDAAKGVCDASVASEPRLSWVCGVIAPSTPNLLSPRSPARHRLRGAPHS